MYNGYVDPGKIFQGSESYPIIANLIIASGADVCKGAISYYTKALCEVSLDQWKVASLKVVLAD